MLGTGPSIAAIRGSADLANGGISCLRATLVWASNVYRTPATGSLISMIMGISVRSPVFAAGPESAGRSVRVRPAESRYT